MAAAERFLEFSDCGSIAPGRWQDECRFVASETLARQGDLVGALVACRGSAYAPQCDDHVLGLLAVTHLADDVPTLAAAFATLQPHLTGRQGEGHLWQHYFRNRLARGEVVVVEPCPPGPCRSSADREISAFVRELQRATGDAPFCAAPPPRPDWVGDEAVAGIVVTQHARGCRSPLERGPPRQ